MLGSRSRDSQEPSTEPLEVVIAGGGVGALEAALALHQLAGDRVRLTLVAPAADFSYQPMAVLEPFVRREPRRLPLARFASELGIDFVQDSVTSVECERGVAHTGGGRLLHYDSLVVAVGARRAAAVAGAVNVDIPNGYESLRLLLDEIDSGAVASIAFVAPRPTWPLPVYELALLLREHARENAVEVKMSILTAEAQPLAVFGADVSAAVTEVLAEAEILTVLDSDAQPAGDGALIAQTGGEPLRFDRVVALPRLQGPAIGGLVTDAEGFLPITAHCELIGAERVYAVGDATDFPVKYGAIAAAQADAAAAFIAAAAGTPLAPAPFDGAVHGFMLRGRRLPRLYFSARIEDGVAHDSHAGEEPAHGQEAKIAARYLGPYLDELWASGARWLSGPWSGSDVLGGVPS